MDNSRAIFSAACIGCLLAAMWVSNEGYENQNLTLEQAIERLEQGRVIARQ
jgi:hypothetical protein